MNPKLDVPFAVSSAPWLAGKANQTSMASGNSWACNTAEISCSNTGFTTWGPGGQWRHRKKIPTAMQYIPVQFLYIALSIKKHI